MDWMKQHISEAADYIIKGNERMVDIAVKYGYDSQDAFSHAFRNLRGVVHFIVNFRDKHKDL